MSLFKQFIKLRDTLSKQAEDNLNNLLVITGESHDVPLNNVLPISNDRTLIIGDGTLRIDDSVGTEIDSIEYTDVSQLDTYISDSYEKWSDVVNEVSNGAECYEMLGLLTTKYSYSNRVSYSDITSYLQNYDGDNYQNISESLFSAVNDDGYISRNNFMGVLNAWVQGGKQATDSDSYDVDKTNPYVLLSITRAVVSAVLTVVSAICLILSQFFGAILAIIGVIISALANLFNNLVEVSEISVDSDAMNHYVAGPVGWCENIPNSRMFIIPYEAHVILSESNGIANFIWPRSFTGQSTGYKSNTYLFPYWRFLETVKYLVNNNIVVFDNDGYDGHWHTNNGETIGNLWKSNAALKYSENATLDNNYEIGASLAIGWLIQSFTAYNIFHSNYRDRFGWSSSMSTLNLSEYENDLLQGISSMIRSCYDLYSDNPSYYDSFDKLLENSDFNDHCKDTIQALANWVSHDVMIYNGNLLGAANSETDITRTESGTTFNIVESFPVIKAPMCGNGAMMISDNGNVVINPTSYQTTPDDPVEADCLPQKFGVTLPQYDASKLNKTLIAIGIIITTVAIGASIIKKVIAKKRAPKQALRANRLNEAREQYLADPTDPNKKKAFEQAVWKYNRFGKWFGWGEYDAANGWMNYPTASDSTSSLLLSDVFSNSVSNTDNSESIIKLIKG